MNDDRLQYTASFVASFSFNFRQVTACTSGIENYFLYKTFWNLYKFSRNTERNLSKYVVFLNFSCLFTLHSLHTSHILQNLPLYSRGTNSFCLPF